MSGDFELVEEYEGLSSRFNVYQGQYNGDSVFVKSSEDVDAWSYGNLEREKVICESLDFESVYTPSVEFYEVEEDGSVFLGYEYLDFESDATVAELWRGDSEFFRSVISQLAGFLLEKQSVTVDVERFQPEFYFDERMRSDVAFSDVRYDEYVGSFDELAVLAENRQSEWEPSFIHGDLFYTNLEFLGSEAVVIDWELAGWFDWLHDAAFVEAAVVDMFAKFVDYTTVEEMRGVFRSLLNLSEGEVSRMKLYKPWVYYVNLEAWEVQQQTAPDFMNWVDGDEYGEYLEGILDNSIQNALES